MGTRYSEGEVEISCSSVVDPNLKVFGRIRIRPNLSKQFLDPNPKKSFESTTLLGSLKFARFSIYRRR
jgi:hypothetical protein